MTGERRRTEAGRAVPADQRPGHRACSACVLVRGRRRRAASSTEHGIVAVPGVLGCAVRRRCSSGRRCCARASRRRRRAVHAQHARDRRASRSPRSSRWWCARYLAGARRASRRYVCPAIGRSLRKTVRTEMKWRGRRSWRRAADERLRRPPDRRRRPASSPTPTSWSSGSAQLADDDRAPPRHRGALRGAVRARLAGRTPRPAWPEIAALVVLGGRASWSSLVV